MTTKSGVSNSLAIRRAASPVAALGASRKRRRRSVCGAAAGLSAAAASVGHRGVVDEYVDEIDSSRTRSSRLEYSLALLWAALVSPAGVATVVALLTALVVWLVSNDGTTGSEL